MSLYARYERPDALLSDQQCQPEIASLTEEPTSDRRAWIWIPMRAKRVEDRTAMVDEVADRLLELDKENEQLEGKMAPRAPCAPRNMLSPDRTLRTIARIAESLHLSIRELAGDMIRLPTFH